MAPGIRASFAQERLWFIESLDHESALYNELLCYRLYDKIDTDILRQSLEEVVRRHESLRTGLSVIDGHVYQNVFEPSRLEITSIDVSGQDDAIKAAGRLMAEWAKKPFDLTSGPLLRPYLFRIGSDEYLFGLITHHTMIDGWSINLFIKELSAIYELMATGKYSTNSLPGIPLQYRDYSACQRNAFDSGEFDCQLSYWLKKLGGELPVLQLPLDYPRPPVQSYAGKTYTVVLTAGLAASLKAIGRKEKATLFMVLLTAFYSLLYRYTGQEDMIVGSPIAGRNALDLEGMIGLCVNTLALRCSIRPGHSFVDTLRQVRATTLEAYDNQDLPFEKLVERLPVQRTLNMSPVFQALFQLRNFSTGAATINGRTVERYEPDEVMAKVDLTLEVADTPTGMSCRFEYPSALFDDNTIARMASHWQLLLENITEDPIGDISRLRIMGDEETASLRVMWEGPKRAYPRESMPDIFEALVRESPDAIAVIHDDERVTYKMLNERADRLAYRLKERGVAPGDNVAVMMERSPGMIAAMLAALKAGAAYVPIDPSDPDDRIDGMLKDARAKAVITGSPTLRNIEGLSEKALIEDGEPGIHETSRSGPDSLAYVMFTSGSTGKPKGVGIPQRGVVRLVVNPDYIRISRGERIAHIANPSFDASTFEIWGALLNGATLVVIDKDTALSPSKLRDFIDSERIDIMLMTTPLFNMIIKEDPKAFQKVRELLVGGDIMEPGPVDAMLKNGPPGRLLNVYGPTENTTFSSVAHVEDAGHITIGYPIANSYVYILDPVMRPLPVGIPGEIYLAGDGLSTGYVSRPDLNAGAFFPDIVDNGRMMYRSGDAGRFLADGNIEFLGRKDGQVKIRGFRVETGEVAAALESLPGVKNAIVLAYDGAGGIRSLAAYLVKSGETAILVEEIRKHLSLSLPSHMIPSSIIWVDHIPLTTRGKTDYKALPSPVSVDRRPYDGGEVQDESLKTMVVIWKDVLGLSAVSPDDDFFSLGGHSLLAVRLIARIEDAFKTRLPVSAVFKTPTARQMADSVAGGQKKSPTLLTLRPGSVRPPLFCIHGVPGTLFEYHRIIHLIDEGRPVYGIQSPGLDGSDIPFESLREMASRYVDEIRIVQPYGPYSLLSYCAAAVFAYEIARQLESLGENVAFLGVIDYMAPKQESRHLPRTIRRYAIDNAGGASAHVKAFLRAGAREKANGLIRLPAFILKKTLRLPGEFSRRDSLSPTGAMLEPVPGVYPDWILALSDPQRTVCMVNQAAVDRYQPGQYGGRISLFMSSEKVDVYRYYREYDPAFGWNNIVTGGVDVHIIEGDHTSLLEGKQASHIAKIIDESLP